MTMKPSRSPELDHAHLHLTTHASSTDRQLLLQPRPQAAPALQCAQAGARLLLLRHGRRRRPGLEASQAALQQHREQVFQEEPCGPRSIQGGLCTGCSMQSSVGDHLTVRDVLANITGETVTRLQALVSGPRLGVLPGKLQCSNPGVRSPSGCLTRQVAMQ